eukprot:3864256-Prymnesium_polylepis.2
MVAFVLRVPLLKLLERSHVFPHLLILSTQLCTLRRLVVELARVLLRPTMGVAEYLSAVLRRGEHHRNVTLGFVRGRSECHVESRLAHTRPHLRMQGHLARTREAALLRSRHSRWRARPHVGRLPVRRSVLLL